MKARSKTIVWLEDVEEHDYPAAESYLRLIYDNKKASKIVKNLRKAAIVEFKAKDIFRASSLSLLGISNLHVRRDVKKINSAKSLSPLLLVRDKTNGKVIIADGYHRLCAVYRFDEDALIPCQIF